MVTLKKEQFDSWEFRISKNGALRYNNVKWIINHQKVDADFSSKIILSDKAHFHLDGFVNRQNCRVWDSENPRVISEEQMHSRRVTIWFWVGDIIHTFLKTRLVKQLMVLDITRFFLLKLDDIDVANMWFQQDGATCRTMKRFNYCTRHFLVVYSLV